MRVAIGFVNQFFTPQLTLGMLDLDTEDFRWVMNPAIDKATTHVRGVNGMLHVGEYLLVGYQSFPTTFIVFDREFQVVAVERFKKLFEVHSICHHDASIYCVSTGTDEVFRLTFEDLPHKISAAFWYRHGASLTRRDRFHLNSIQSDSKRLLATCFGPKVSGSWANSRQGQLIDLMTGRVIRSGLHQPHSVTFQLDQWWICESGTGRIIGENGTEIELGGYVRGMVPISETKVCIASSAQRIQSRSKGTLNVGVQDSRGASKSTISVVDLESQKVERSIELTKYGAEIFELIPLSAQWCPDWVMQKDPLEIQVDHLERQLLRLRKSTLRKNRITQLVSNRLAKMLRI